MNDIVFRRLNPLTIAVEFGRVVARFVVPLVVLLIFGQKDSNEFIAQAIGGVVVFSAFARYWTFRYAIHEGTLTIKSGVLVKNVRSIPLENIQNINISKTLIHRLLGLVDLKIETAAGGGAEASLSALSVPEAEKVKLELMGRAIIEHVVVTPGKTLYIASTKELVLAGATENKALTIIGAIFGFSVFLQGPLRSLSESILPDQGGSWLLLIAASIAMLAVGWVFSIVSMFVVYAGFELQMVDGQIRRHYGLINQIESVVPLRRVQALRAKQTILQRCFGVCKLYVETAGSYQKEDISGSSLVSPLLDFSKLRTLSDELLPGRNIESINWHKISRKTIQATARRTFIPLVMIVVPLAAYFGGLWLLMLIPLIGYTFFLGWLRFKATEFGWTEKVFGTKHGAFSKTSVFVPVERIQSISVHESPLQRRLGMRSAIVNTAAIGGGNYSNVQDMITADCERLASALHQSSVNTASFSSQVL